MYETDGTDGTGGYSRGWYLRQLLRLGGFYVLGMILSSLAAYVLLIPLFHINLFSNPWALSDMAGDANKINATRFVQVIGTLGTFVLPAWVVARPLGGVAHFTRMRQLPSVLFLVAIPVLFFVSSPLGSWLVNWNKQAHLPEFLYPLENLMKQLEDNAAEVTAGLTSGKTAADLVVNLLLIALLAALVEEFLFRGVLQRLLIAWSKNAWVGIIAASVIFSAIHLQFFGFFPRLTLGILMGVLYYSSGSLWTSILFHFLNNAFAVVIMHYGLDKGDNPLFSESYTFPVYMVLLSALLTCAVCYYLYKNRVADGTELEQRVQHE